MSAELYKAVIDQWCEATGMQPWPVDDDANIDIDGTTTGLLYDAQRSPRTLHVLSDLGAYEHPDMPRYLLELNAEIEPEHGGYFAIHPTSGHVVFRLEVALADLPDGGILPSLIHTALGLARGRLLS